MKRAAIPAAAVAAGRYGRARTKSIRLTFVESSGLALLFNFLAALGTLPAQRPVSPAAGLRLPALEPDVVLLGPETRLEDEGKTDSGDDDASRTGQGTDQRSDHEQQEQADDKDRPLDHRTVDERTPLISRDHAGDVGARAVARKDLRLGGAPR